MRIHRTESGPSQVSGPVHSGYSFIFFWNQLSAPSITAKSLVLCNITVFKYDVWIHFFGAVSIEALHCIGFLYYLMPSTMESSYFGIVRLFMGLKIEIFQNPIVWLKWRANLLSAIIQDLTDSTCSPGLAKAMTMQFGIGTDSVYWYICWAIGATWGCEQVPLKFSSRCTPANAKLHGRRTSGITPAFLSRICFTAWAYGELCIFKAKLKKKNKKESKTTDLISFN